MEPRYDHDSSPSRPDSEPLDEGLSRSSAWNAEALDEGPDDQLRSADGVLVVVLRHLHPGDESMPGDGHLLRWILCPNENPRQRPGTGRMRRPPEQ
jgi:hypothetical protein